MVNKYFLTNSPSQTKKLGEKFAKKILKETSKKKALIFGLKGELGGGKTTFLQGFAKGLKVKEKILSPTFIIVKKFQIPNYKLQIHPRSKMWCGGKNSKLQIAEFKTFYHIDCYRIEKPKEILDLGFKEVISDPQNIAAIEWAEKIKEILPKNTTWINFNFISKNIRKIRIKYTV